MNHLTSSAQGLLLLRVVGATGAALLGGMLALPVPRTSHRLMCALVSFAAGGLLAVAALHVIPETAELLGPARAGAAVLAGLIGFWTVGRFVYFVCPACSASHQEKGYVRLGWLMIVAMTLHSLTDGLAITAGYEADHHAGAQLGLLIFIAVSYHKVPEGLALMGVMRMAGLRAGAALGATALAELTTGIGALAGLLLLGLSPGAMGVLLGVVGGSFLYVVLFAMLKEMWVHEKTSILLYASLGAASIVVLGRLLGHG